MSLIGVTCQYRGSQDFRPLWGSNGYYLESLTSCGATPLLIPPLPADRLGELLQRLDGVVLTGGPDLDPIHYGEEMTPGQGEVNPQRDALDLAVARLAAERGLPLLGICRGIQVANVALGGSLHQDLAQAGFTSLAHAQKSPPPVLAHRIDLEPEAGALREIFPESFRTNSYHHQGLKDLAPGLQVLATAPDGLIEAASLRGHPFYLLVQWHPEMLPEQRGLFASLIRASQAVAA